MKLATAVIVSIASALQMAAQDLPKGETVFDKYVEATGGEAAYKARRSEVSKGVVRMQAAGVAGTVEIWSSAPNKQVIVMDVQGVGRLEQGTDGANAWEISAVAGPRVKSGMERTEALREAMFNIPIRWRELYSKVETVAAEQAEGLDCYKVVATPNSGGKPETWWFDRKTGLTVKVKRTAVTGMGEIPAELVSRDFKKAGGILQPTTMVQRAGGQEIVIQLQSVTPNVVIPASKFAPPAEIRQLLPATTAPARKKAA